MTDTRQRLLDGAATCIRDRGVSSTSSRAITATAGVNLAAITHHFGSKDELVAESLLATIRAALEPALAVLGRDDIEPPARTLLAV